MYKFLIIAYLFTQQQQLEINKKKPFEKKKTRKNGILNVTISYEFFSLLISGEEEGYHLSPEEFLTNGEGPEQCPGRWSYKANKVMSSVMKHLKITLVDVHVQSY